MTKLIKPTFEVFSQPTFLFSPKFGKFSFQIQNVLIFLPRKLSCFIKIFSRTLSKQFEQPCGHLCGREAIWTVCWMCFFSALSFLSTGDEVTATQWSSAYYAWSFSTQFSRKSFQSKCFDTAAVTCKSGKKYHAERKMEKSLTRSSTTLHPVYLLHIQCIRKPEDSQFAWNPKIYRSI